MHKILSRTVLLIQVSRPLIWPVLPLVYLLGAHAAQAEVTAAAVLQIVLLTFPMNLVGCGLNDIYDMESDRRSVRRRAVWGAVVRDEDQPLILRACAAMVPIIVFGACLTRNWDNIVATVALVLMAWAYSVPPVRLKERPPLDTLANGLGYFLLPFIMGYSLGADPRSMPLKYYLLALCVCGIHSLATSADYEADRAAGHRTMAVAFGKRAAAAAACATFVVAIVAGGYHGISVRAFLAMGALATLIAAAFPYDRVITIACSTIFGGFLIAAVCHLLGW